MKPLKLTPFGREIALLLMIKLVLIVTTKLVFFSDPVKPGSDGTAQALLNHPAMERNAHHE